MYRYLKITVKLDFRPSVFFISRTNHCLTTDQRVKLFSIFVKILSCFYFYFEFDIWLAVYQSPGDWPFNIFLLIFHSEILMFLFLIFQIPDKILRQRWLHQEAFLHAVWCVSVPVHVAQVSFFIRAEQPELGHFFLTFRHFTALPVTSNCYKKNFIFVLNLFYIILSVNCFGTGTLIHKDRKVQVSFIWVVQSNFFTFFKEFPAYPNMRLFSDPDDSL